MSPIKPLGCLIDDVTTFDKYITELDGLEEILFIENRFPEYPFWMKYQSGNYFAFNIGKIPLLAEMLDKAELIFRNIVPLDYEIDRKKIRLIRNSKRIISHIDRERLSAINIGLKNSSSATIFISTDNNDEESFLKNRTSFIIKEGYGYLFNPTQRHSVSGTDVSRYLLSYSMNIPYEVLFDKIDKINNPVIV